MKRILAMLLLVAAVGAALWTWRADEAPIHLSSPGQPGSEPGPVPDAPTDPYLRGAHWFGEGWAINFWNTRLLERAAEDFAALREDGFNTVVLVVPWPGFAPGMTEGRLDPQRAERLAALIDVASEARLNVVLRIGYARDAIVPDGGRWGLALWLDEDVRQAWLRHIAALWNLVGERPGVRFAFISWEDLWAVEKLGERNHDERLTLARDTGYRDWLQRYSTLEAVASRYGIPFRSWQEVPIPRRTEPAFGLFFDFIDHAWVHRFFEPAQALFPTLSMEVRIDSDPVWNAPGDLAYWHSHELAWDLPDASWTTVYWSPAMGGENRGERLSPETAAERLAFQLRRLRRVTGDRPIFIDQFLVEDFTPGQEMNGRLARDDVPAFLSAARPMLASLAHGYALWTWRDYAHDAVTSPDFFRLSGNWDGAAPDGDDAPGYTFRPGERLQRSFNIHDFHAPGGPESAELCIEAVADGDTDPDLRVTSDVLTEKTELDVSGSGRACVGIAVKPLTTVTLEALAQLELFTIRFVGFTQPTGVRDIDGQPKPVAAAWRGLNAALTRTETEPFRAFDDGWMAKTLTGEVSAPRGRAPLQLRLSTHLPTTWPFQPRLSVRLNGSELGTVPCSASGESTLPVDRGQLVPGRQSVTVTVDRTYRPDGDDRRLGCVVKAFELEKVD